MDNREKIPVATVWVYDTTNTVPSNGFFVKYYSGVNNSDPSLKRTQFEPSIMKDWAGGLPVELSSYVKTFTTNSGVAVSDPFSITYSGYFFAPSSGLYNFATRTNGGVEIFVNNISVLSGYSLIAPTLTGYATGIWAGKPYYWNGSQYLATGWQNYKLNFYWYRDNVSGTVGNPFLSAFYTPQSGTETLLTASAISPTPSFLQPTVLSNVMMATEDTDAEMSNQATFEVTVAISGDYTWSRAREDFGKLKINRLCNLFMGYVTEPDYYLTNGYSSNLTSANDLIKRFTGLVDNVSLAQTKDSLTATVSCRDFKKKLLNGINENYPNRANYTPSVLNQIDKFKRFNIDNIMPNAYDGWSAFNTIEMLALNGGVDPKKINKSKWDIANYFNLEANLNWPFTTVTDINGIETKDGDPYIFQMQYGENLSDEMKKISDLIGYNTYFDEEGDLVVREPRRTNRVEVYETGNYASKALTFTGPWKTNVDINASNRFYSAPINNPGGGFSSGTVSIAFSGVGFGMYQFNHTSGSTYRVDIYNKNPGNLVFSKYYTNSGLVSYGNKIEFTRDLSYDGYNAYVYPSGDLRIEGFEYYTQNIFKPTYVLMDDRDISTLNIDLNDYTVRNEVIAVGQQVSDKGYLYSKAIDLDSIANPDAFNYVGEKRTFTLIEPTIQSQQRLDWLSSNVLSKYRRKQRNISITAQGLPHIQVNDPVGIISRKVSLDSTNVSGYDITNNEVYYVNKISSSLSKATYSTTLSLTSLKPIESWRPPVSITSDILNLIYQSNNNSIFANFVQNTQNGPGGSGYDGFSEQAAFISFDCLIDVDRLWVLISDSADGGQVFKNVDVLSKSPQITYQISKGTDPNQPPQSAVWLHNGGGERWGHLTVPTSNNSFNNGQWIGQNSESKVRLNGTYPIAIWAQFKTSDNATVFQGIWSPTSGTLPNVNRQLAWSSTSEYNTYMSYTTNTDGAVIQTPVNPSLKLSYLPAFVTNNSDMRVDLWIGPSKSGYQMVAGNIIQNMSGTTPGKFAYLGDQWNSSYDASNSSYYTAPWNFGTIWSVFNEGNDISATVPNGDIVMAKDAPWKTGDNILFTGDAPTADTIIAVYRGLFNASGPGRTRYNYKNIFGWTPQGVDYLNTNINTGPAYVNSGVITNMKYHTGTVKSGSLESLNHIGNFITLRLNRDAYIDYTAVEIGIDSKYYNYGSPGGMQSANVYNYAIRTNRTSRINVPVKGDVSIYLEPGMYDTNGPAFSEFYSQLSVANIQAMGYGTFANGGLTTVPDVYSKYKYTATAMVPYSDATATFLLRNNEVVPGGEPSMHHMFTITDAKTNQKYHFSMRTPINITKSYALLQNSVFDWPILSPRSYTEYAITLINGVYDPAHTPRQYNWPRVL